VIAQIVFYLTDDERDRLIDELAFLLRSVYGENRDPKQYSFQIPHIQRLLLLLLSFSPSGGMNSEPK